MPKLDCFTTEELVAEVIKRGFKLQDLAPLILAELSTSALSRELRRRQSGKQTPEARRAQAKKAADARWKL